MSAGLVTTGTGTLTLNGNDATNAAAGPATITGNRSLGAASRTFAIADGAAAVDLVVNALASAPAGIGGEISL